MKKSIIGHVTPADGNVFLDLGFPPDVAAAMLAESNESIRLKMLAKSKKPGGSYKPGGGPSSEQLLGQVQTTAAKPKGRVRAKPKLST